MTPRTLTFAIGAALIIVANGIALTGVAYNRSGEPESRLTLSQRELERPWSGHGTKEDSGLSLTLEWRVPAPDTESDYPRYEGRGGSPAWLDEKRMAELGFDVRRAKGDSTRRNQDMNDAERQVLVVLELAGAAWQQALERARQRLAHQESLRQANPQAKELIEAEKLAREGLAREENENSRLFAIDVGTDLASLRAKYPDRGRYLILKGNVRLFSTFRDKKPVVAGYLSRLSPNQINVPNRLRGTFEAMPPRSGGPGERKPPFTAIVPVGRRLEPWIDAVATP
ncbi:DUF4824 family protein [Ralstonia sp. UBA689]|uniref:DUF4824 family protein n=1 Tax=Ralstonia sp. UBA689 TaxID=1947373 RepID=UPI0025F13A6E|nr:DUF4824 family protein [Ralstonia sp. UBA689]